MGRQDSGAHRFHHPFLFFFSGDRTAPPLSPLRWVSEAPGPSACSGITPGTPPSPTFGEPHSLSAQPRGTQTPGTETPSAPAPSCPSPAPASSRLTEEGRAEEEGASGHRV